MLMVAFSSLHGWAWAQLKLTKYNEGQQTIAEANTSNNFVYWLANQTTPDPAQVYSSNIYVYWIV